MNPSQRSILYTRFNGDFDRAIDYCLRTAQECPRHAREYWNNAMAILDAQETQNIALA